MARHEDSGVEDPDRAERPVAEVLGREDLRPYQDLDFLVLTDGAEPDEPVVIRVSAILAIFPSKHPARPECATGSTILLSMCPASIFVAEKASVVADLLTQVLAPGRHLT